MTSPELQLDRMRQHLFSIFELREELKERLTAMDHEIACLRQLLNDTNTGGEG